MRRRSVWRALAAMTALFAFAPVAHARTSTPAPRIIYYNQGNGLVTERTLGFKVLELALQKSGVRYELRPSPVGRVTEPRAIEAIRTGNQMDVAMLGASDHADALLAPVRIPVDRGLLGYRIFMIDRTRQPEFDNVRTREDLARYTALQGKGWPDTRILRNAGITVWTGAYSRLFAMTVAGRGDMYPRGVVEAYGELELHRPELPTLVLEKGLALHYRFTSFFYVAKSNTVLLGHLYRGMERAYADGSYDRLFNTDPSVRRALALTDLRHRRIIEMDNPFLSPETRAIPEHYWWRP